MHMYKINMIYITKIIYNIYSREAGKDDEEINIGIRRLF